MRPSKLREIARPYPGENNWIDEGFDPAVEHQSGAESGDSSPDSGAPSKKMGIAPFGLHDKINPATMSNIKVLSAERTITIRLARNKTEVLPIESTFKMFGFEFAVHPREKDSNLYTVSEISTGMNTVRNEFYTSPARARDSAKKFLSLLGEEKVKSVINAQRTNK